MPDVHRDDGYDPDRWDARLIIARDGARELEDGVYRRTLASLNNGWLARGGHLRLHDDRLSFAPTPFERLLLARPVSVDFVDIERVERHPERPEDVLPGGKAPRMRVRTTARLQHPHILSQSGLRAFRYLRAGSLTELPCPTIFSRSLKRR